MGIMSGGSLGVNQTAWFCQQCSATRAFDTGAFGPPDFELVINPGGLTEAENASCCMTVDPAGGVWIFFGTTEETVCWYISHHEVALELRTDEHVAFVSTAHAVSASEVYVQFGFEESRHGILSKEGGTLKLTEWTFQGPDDDSSLCFDCSFNGRLLRLGSLLVGLADNGVWTMRAASAVLGSDHTWQKLLDLADDEHAQFRVLGLGAETDQVIIFCTAALDGLLRPAHFLRPTHVLRLNDGPDSRSSGASSEGVTCIVQQLSSLVVIPVHGSTLYQRMLPDTSEAISARNWNSSVFPLGMRELNAIIGGSCLGRSTLLFDLSGYAYRIRDDEVVQASAGWRPTSCSFDADRTDVVLSFQRASHEHTKLKCPAEPLLRYEYFKSLLSGWQEGKAHEVVLDDVELDSFQDILRFIHTGEIVCAPLGRTTRLLRVASKYMIEDLVALLLRSLRLTLSSYDTVRLVGKGELLDLLISAGSMGRDGLGLMQDAATAIVDHRMTLLKDAQFMAELSSRSETAFETVMASIVDGRFLDLRSRLFRKHLAKAATPSWSVFPQRALDSGRREESASGCRVRSRSRGQAK